MTKAKTEPRKIVFGHHRALGDCLMFTCGVRDFKLAFPGLLDVYLWCERF
jgi:hypothetical protein